MQTMLDSAHKRTEKLKFLHSILRNVGIIQLGDGIVVSRTLKKEPEWGNVISISYSDYCININISGGPVFLDIVDMTLVDAAFKRLTEKAMLEAGIKIETNTRLEILERFGNES